MDGITNPTYFRYTARSKTFILLSHCGFRIKLLLQPNLAPSDSKHHPWTSIGITWRLRSAQSLHWTSWIIMCLLRRSLDNLYISFLGLPYQKKKKHKHRKGGLNHRKFFLTVLESQDQDVTIIDFPWGFSSWLSWLAAVSCPHVAFSLCACIHGVILISPSYKATSQIGLGPSLVASF